MLGTYQFSHYHSKFYNQEDTNKEIKLNIFQCYAPRNEVENRKKDDFYKQLQTVLDKNEKKKKENKLVTSQY